MDLNTPLLQGSASNEEDDKKTPADKKSFTIEVVGSSESDLEKFNEQTQKFLRDPTYKKNSATKNLKKLSAVSAYITPYTLLLTQFVAWLNNPSADLPTRITDCDFQTVILPGGICAIISAVTASYFTFSFIDGEEIQFKEEIFDDQKPSPPKSATVKWLANIASFLGATTNARNNAAGFYFLFGTKIKLYHWGNLYEIPYILNACVPTTLSNLPSLRDFFPDYVKKTRRNVRVAYGPPLSQQEIDSPDGAINFLRYLVRSVMLKVTLLPSDFVATLEDKYTHINERPPFLEILTDLAKLDSTKPLPYYRKSLYIVITPLLGLLLCGFGYFNYLEYGKESISSALQNLLQMQSNPVFDILGYVGGVIALGTTITTTAIFLGDYFFLHLMRRPENLKQKMLPLVLGTLLALLVSASGVALTVADDLVKGNIKPFIITSTVVLNMLTVAYGALDKMISSQINRGKYIDKRQLILQLEGDLLYIIEHMPDNLLTKAAQDIRQYQAQLPSRPRANSVSINRSASSTDDEKKRSPKSADNHRGKRRKNCCDKVSHSLRSLFFSTPEQKPPADTSPTQHRPEQKQRSSYSCVIL